MEICAKDYACAKDYEQYAQYQPLIRPLVMNSDPQ